MINLNFAIIVPMANESKDFDPFISALKKTLDEMGSGTVYLVVDTVSLDNTLQLCNELSMKDERFITIYEPSNKNIVDAYLRGYREAYEKGHTYIIEMDAGMSHDPKEIPIFVGTLNEGKECVFGSRFMPGGEMKHSNFKRLFLSKFGTVLANVLLGSKMHDMTSGYQGFQKHIVKQILDYGLISKAHFYQTEVRYLLRNKKIVEIPIRYKTPSPSVSQHAIFDSIKVLLFYFMNRIRFRAKIIQ